MEQSLQLRGQSAGLLLVPGLHHRTLISWANNASRVVEEMKAEMCEGCVVFPLHQLLYVSYYYVKYLKCRFESCCMVSM